MNSKIVDWKIQTHLTHVKTSNNPKLHQWCHIGLFLHKWGGLDFQSTIFEAFVLTFFDRVINRAVKLSALQDWIIKQHSKLITIPYHDSYECIIMLEKCGRIDLTVFHLIWVIGTYGNWKNHNPGGRFGATS